MKKNVKPLYWIAFIIYLVLLIKTMLIRLPISEIKTSLSHMSFAIFWERLKAAQYVPLKTILYHYEHTSIKMTIQSFGWVMLWMIPFGYFMPLLTKKKRYIDLVIIGLLTGLIIELLQLILGTGMLDVDDILLTAVGVSIGYIFYKVFK